jgi:hypothetical protein
MSYLSCCINFQCNRMLLFIIIIIIIIIILCRSKIISADFVYIKYLGYNPADSYWRHGVCKLFLTCRLCFKIWRITTNINYLISRVHLYVASGTRVVAVKPKATEILFSARLWSFYYILHKKYYLHKCCTFWPTCIAVHHFRVLAWVVQLALSPHEARILGILIVLIVGNTRLWCWVVLHRRNVRINFRESC